MGHIKQEKIEDLKKELDAIRGFDGIKEKGVGVFYYKSTPFMHFHDKDDKRWADVKCPDGAWLHIEIQFSAKAQQKKLFLKKVEKAYQELTTPQSRR